MNWDSGEEDERQSQSVTVDGGKLYGTIWCRFHRGIDHLSLRGSVTGDYTYETSLQLRCETRAAGSAPILDRIWLNPKEVLHFKITQPGAVQRDARELFVIARKLNSRGQIQMKIEKVVEGQVSTEVMSSVFWITVVDQAFEPQIEFLSDVFPEGQAISPMSLAETEPPVLFWVNPSLDTPSVTPSVSERPQAHTPFVYNQTHRLGYYFVLLRLLPYLSLTSFANLAATCRSILARLQSSTLWRALGSDEIVRRNLPLYTTALTRYILYHLKIQSSVIQGRIDEAERHSFQRIGLPRLCPSVAILFLVVFECITSTGSELEIVGHKSCHSATQHFSDLAAVLTPTRQGDSLSLPLCKLIHGYVTVVGQGNYSWRLKQNKI